MIRINLLPHKKKSSSGISVEGEKVIALGMGVIMAAIACIFLFVHGPMQDDIETQNSKNARLKSDIEKSNAKTKNFTELKAAFSAAQAQAGAIKALNKARATPANFLYELSQILQPGVEPSMTPQMKADLKDNENLHWEEDWDAQHIWIHSIKESEGSFVLTGSALSDGDVTQLAHRLVASAYFDNVEPQGAIKKAGLGGTAALYDFTITGKVRY